MLTQFQPIELATVIRPDILAFASEARLARMLMLHKQTHDAISTGWPVRVMDQREARVLGIYAGRIEQDLVWQNQIIDLQCPCPMAWPRVGFLEEKTPWQKKPKLKNKPQS